MRPGRAFPGSQDETVFFFGEPPAQSEGVGGHFGWLFRTLFFFVVVAGYWEKKGGRSCTQFSSTILEQTSRRLVCHSPKWRKQINSTNKIKPQRAGINAGAFAWPARGKSRVLLFKCFALVFICRMVLFRFTDGGVCFFPPQFVRWLEWTNFNILIRFLPTCFQTVSLNQFLIRNHFCPVPVDAATTFFLHCIKFRTIFNLCSLVDFKNFSPVKYL